MPRRIAVAAPCCVVAAWQARAIEALRTIEEVDLVVVATGDRPVPMSRLSASMLRLSCAPVRLDTVKGASFDGYDLVLDLGDGRVTSDAPFGVWSYRVGKENDLGLPFACEYADGEDTVQIELVRRTSSGTTSIRRGRFAASAWYPSTVHKSLSEAASWPAELVRALHAGATLQEDAPALSSLTTAGSDAQRAIMPFIGSVASRVIRGLASEALMDHRWNVGFVAGGPRRLLSGEPLEVKWLNGSRSGGWIADPFMVERDGVRAIFVEDMDEARGRGVVEALVVDDDGNVIRRHRIIERATHLSYPYPLEVDGQLYLVPESWATNTVTPYRCVRFPDLWEEEPPLIPDLDAVDTTIVRHGGRWWALFTRETRGPDLALHAYHADTPFGTWKPHALNPIVIDVATARPAGRPFVVDGRLYRPAQDCSAAYGSAVTIARVDELTPLSYRETVVRRVVPDRFGPYRHGLHTVSVCGDRVVIDGKQTFQDVRTSGNRLFRIVRRAIGALRRRYRAA